MLYTTLTNLRTLSFAFVMAAMLMVGTMAPVHGAQAQSQADLQQMINNLLAQVAQLQQQLLVLESNQNVVSTVCPYAWTRDLSIGSRGADVQALQKFLNQDNDTRVNGLLPGQETMFFGPATAQAVSKFQVKYRSEVLTPAGVVNPTGFFGITSRAKANSLCTAAVTLGAASSSVNQNTVADASVNGSSNNQAEANNLASLNSYDSNAASFGSNARVIEISPSTGDFVAARAYERHPDGYIVSSPAKPGFDVRTGNFHTAKGLFTLKAQGMGEAIAVGSTGNSKYLVTEVPDDVRTINGVPVEQEADYYSSRSEARLIMDGKQGKRYSFKTDFYIDPASDTTVGENGRTLLQQIVQTKRDTAPVLSMNLNDAGELVFVKRTWKDNPTQRSPYNWTPVYTTPAVSGKWHTIEYEFVLDSKDDGMLNIWFNGNQVVDESNIKLSQCTIEEEETADCNFSAKVGVYRGFTGDLEQMKVLYRNISITSEDDGSYVAPEPVLNPSSYRVEQIASVVATKPSSDTIEFTVTLDHDTWAGANPFSFKSYGTGRGDNRPGLVTSRLRSSGYEGSVSDFEDKIDYSAVETVEAQEQAVEAAAAAELARKAETTYRVRDIESVVATKPNKDTTEFTVTLDSDAWTGDNPFSFRSYGIGWAPIVVSRLRASGYEGLVSDFEGKVEYQHEDFGVSDIESIVAAQKGEYTTYTITLKNGIKLEVRAMGKGVQNADIADLRSVGYQGTINQFNDLYVPNGYYEVRHVESVISVVRRAGTTIEYTEFTITLKSYVGGQTYTLRTYGKDKTTMLVGSLRATKYKGNVSDIQAMVQQR
jgi:peptidoglycan hydrolase-like protein with peptidoglycan-binding domain